MDSFLHNSTNVWLAAGAFLVVFEAITSPGLGLFLGGLGALCTALLIKAGVVEEASTAAQFAWFFGLTTVWTVALWKPMRKFRMGRKSSAAPVQNIIGETAIVGKDGLKRGALGQVSWSGTLMNAILDTSAAVDLPAGAQVEIKAVSGTTLTVAPK